MKKNAGFTLLELLIAATILGIMAMFAAVSYRNSMAETRLAAARGRLDVLAAAVQRYQLDYGEIAGGQLKNSAVEHPLCSSSAGVTALFGCGFLENGGWSDAYVRYYVCNTANAGKCFVKEDATDPVTVPATVTNPLACVQTISTAKWPERYKNYTYCTSATTSGSN